MPYELSPDASKEGEDLYAYLPRSQVESSIDRLNLMGQELGIHFNNKNKKFNTRRAHLAGYYAKDQGLYESFSKKVFEAYFVDGVNIAQEDILSKIADEAGLNSSDMNNLINSGAYTERLFADFEIADRNTINVVPTFIAGEDVRFSGIVAYKDFKKIFDGL